MTALSSRELRRIILEQSMRAGVGHIGSALSVVEILAVLYGGVLRPGTSAPDDRDRFILSKGHAALALYAALHLTGKLSREELDTYCGDDSRLGVHPERVLPGVDFSTGSLGQGPSVAAGAALAARLQHSSRRAFALVSDAECNEGAVWEAAMFAAHHRLGNLVLIADMNGQQALGRTADVLAMEPMADKWRAFGWDVREVGGHDAAALSACLDGLDTDADVPHILLARTTFGKGVSFMEGRVKWHYWPMSDEEYRLALDEVETGS